MAINDHVIQPKPDANLEYMDARDKELNASVEQLDDVLGEEDVAFGADFLDDGPPEEAENAESIMLPNVPAPVPIALPKHAAIGPATPSSDANFQLWLDRRSEQLQAQEDQKRREKATITYSQMMGALNNQTWLEGTIAGVSSGDKYAYWTLYRDGIIIQIPFSESYTTLPDELHKSDRSTINRQKNFLAKSLGAKITFVLTSVSADPYGVVTFMASRVKAMAGIRSHYFGPNVPKDRKLAIGKRDYGSIISSNAKVAYVTFAGIDVRVPRFHITHEPVDLAKAYPIDSDRALMPFEVEQLRVNPNGMPVLKLSRRRIELEEFKSRYHLVKPGSIHMAEVVMTREITKADQTKYVAVELWLHGLRLPGFSRTFRLTIQDELHSGDMVHVQVAGITKDGYVHGSIIRFCHRV